MTNGGNISTNRPVLGANFVKIGLAIAPSKSFSFPNHSRNSRVASRGFEGFQQNNIIKLWPIPHPLRRRQQSDATTRRKQRDAQVQSITDRRLTIQFAADAEWPYTVDANAGIRGECFLPLSQPFHG